MKRNIFLGASFAMLLMSNGVNAQVVNDVNTPLHLMKAQYATSYGIPQQEDVKASIDKVLNYLKVEMPAEMNGDNIKRGGFRLTSYEMGVLYSACVEVSKSAKDAEYLKFVTDRLQLLAQNEPKNVAALQQKKSVDGQMRSVINPQALDDAGAMCAGFIRMQLAQGITYDKTDKNIRSIIDRYINFVYKKQFRLPDGTLARIRPHINTVWLDDMYMGIPCLAWYAAFTGKTEYMDEALRQIRLFKEKMWVEFNYDGSGLFRHGWVEEMQAHPMYPWGRANGWAILTMSEVLDAMTVMHYTTGFEEVKTLFNKHVSGLSKLQDKSGFWHQLLNDNTTYLETSATAIYAYCFAHAMNEGWIDTILYGAQTLLAWHAVATQVNAKGQVENTCVGTGMGFDPAFYAARPVHVMAAHGYGPVIWAGGEIIRFLNNSHPKMNDSAVQFYKTEQKTKSAIFSEQRGDEKVEKVLW